MELNTVLREQLDQAHLANQKLSEDVRRLTGELQQVRDDLTKRTRDWKEEERVRTRDRLLALITLDRRSVGVQSILQQRTQSLV